MGWNDFSKLVVISFFAGVLSVFYLFAQDRTVPGGKDSNLPPAYSLKPVFKTQVYYNYNLYDTTSVVRVYPDSSIKRFKRIITYFMTLMQPDPPKNGFSYVEVSIDSIHYRFEEEKKIYQFWNIETANPEIFKFEDFQTYNIPMGLEYTLVYSPYGEVAKIEGERLQEKRLYVEKLKPTMRDTLWLYNWTEGLSDFKLKHISDVIRISYPVNPVYKDSAWLSPIELDIDGINLFDTTVVKCTGFLGNKYYIEGNFSKPFAKWKKTKFYGVKTLSLPYSVEVGSGTFKQILTSAGLVQTLKIRLDIVLSVGGEKNVFNEHLAKTMHWEMEKSYRFK